MGAGTVSLEIAILIGSIFLLVSVVASKISSKLGIPALVLFVGIGMLAGSEGPGGIEFSNYELTKEVGLVMLAMILFAGGLDSNWSDIRPIAGRAILLSTLGVVATAGIVGAFAHYVLGLPILVGLLLGSIISSTDSAAIFSVLRVRGLFLKHRLAPLLEFESGTNDPVAVFLTVGITELVANPSLSPAILVPRLFIQMPVGVATGTLGGIVTVWFINRIRLEYDGLYSVITLAAAGLIYGVTHLLQGSEFLAVYVLGLTIGSRNFVHRVSLVQFHDGLAWVMQIGVFLLLGLLVFPSQLVPNLGTGAVVALLLMFLARPLAVFGSLVGTTMTKRARFFAAWAGLRGGFPIILGTFPILAGLEAGPLIFNVVFFVVLFSVLVQGSTLRWVGQKLNVLVNRAGEPMIPAHSSELLEIEIKPGSPSAGKQVIELGLPRTALIVLLKRGERAYIPRGGSIIEPGDRLLLATRREDHDELRNRIESRP